MSLNGRIQSVYVSTFTSAFHVFGLVPLCRQGFAVTVVYIFTCPCVCVFSQRKPVEGKLAIGERSEWMAVLCIWFGWLHHKLWKICRITNSVLSATAWNRMILCVCVSVCVCVCERERERKGGGNECMYYGMLGICVCACGCAYVCLWRRVSATMCKIFISDFNSWSVIHSAQRI